MLCLMATPLIASAQDKSVKTPYDPGKWYVGLRLEAYWLSTSESFYQSRQVPPSASGAGLNAWFGHHLTRHIDVQVGAFFNFNSVNNSNQSVYRQVINDTVTYQESRFVGQRPFYVPLVVKLVPFGSHRRIQPYMLAGMSMAIGRVQKNTLEYDPTRTMTRPGDTVPWSQLVYSTTSEKQGFKTLFGAYVGIGLKVRVVNRVSISLDGAFGRNLSRYGNVTANGGIGFLYDFASTK